MIRKNTFESLGRVDLVFTCSGMRLRRGFLSLADPALYTFGKTKILAKCSGGHKKQHWPSSHTPKSALKLQLVLVLRFVNEMKVEIGD